MAVNGAAKSVPNTRISRFSASAWRPPRWSFSGVPHSGISGRAHRIARLLTDERSASFAEAAGRLRGRGHLADREGARDAAQAAVGRDLQPLGVAVLQAGPDQLDDVVRCLGVVRLDVDEPGGQDEVAVPVA